MDVPVDGSWVGYSVFDTIEECWQYNENACFIASSKSEALAFLENGFTPADKCRIDPVSFDDMMQDFGFSSGAYAIQRDAFVRFRTLAESQGIHFTAEPFDGDESLLVVEIDGAAVDDD